MGNNIAVSIIKLFDRRQVEIESISGKVDRDRIRGCHERHEIFVDNFEMFRYRSRQTNPNQVKQLFCFY